MRRLAVEGDGMAFDAEGAKDRAQRQIQVEQHRPLFDVEFKIGGRIAQLFAAVLNALEINADLLQRVRQRDAVLVLEPSSLVHVEGPGAGGRAEQALSEACALLVRPIHEADGDGRLAVVLRADAPENLHARQHIQAAVQPAPVGYGVHMPAND